MLYATAGMKIAIGGVKADQSADFTAGDFTGTTWVEIKGHENLGSLGDASEEIAIALVEPRRTLRLKGTRSSPPMELVLAADYGDAGQQALIAAEKTDYDYAFRVTFDDAPPSGTPSQRLFIAKVGSVTEQYDAANSVIRMNVSLWVNSNVVRVNAA